MSSPSDIIRSAKSLESSPAREAEDDQGVEASPGVPRETWERVYIYLQSAAASQGYSDDIVQEACVALLEAVAEGRVDTDEESLRKYGFRTLANLYANTIRKKTRKAERGKVSIDASPVELPNHEREPIDVLIRHETARLGRRLQDELEVISRNPSRDESQEQERQVALFVLERMMTKPDSFPTLNEIGAALRPENETGRRQLASRVLARIVMQLMKSGFEAEELEE
jgi:DNA-directed RNA polymerase specialized sigma24 family protein